VYNYFVLREEIEKSVRSRETLDMLARRLNMSVPTAGRYRRKYLREAGIISEKRANELREEYIARTLGDLDAAERVALKEMLEAFDPATKRAKPARDRFIALNSLLATKKEAREFFKAIGVLKETEQGVQVNVVISEKMKRWFTDEGKA
jgi:DNA-binding transcriptional ArsR family regulator